VDSSAHRGRWRAVKSFCELLVDVHRSVEEDHDHFRKHRPTGPFGSTETDRESPIPIDITNDVQKVRQSRCRVRSIRSRFSSDSYRKPRCPLPNSIAKSSLKPGFGDLARPASLLRGTMSFVPMIWTQRSQPVFSPKPPESGFPVSCIQSIYSPPLLDRLDGISGLLSLSLEHIVPIEPSLGPTALTPRFYHTQPVASRQNVSSGATTKESPRTIYSDDLPASD